MALDNLKAHWSSWREAEVMNPLLKQSILEQVEQLRYEQQRQVLDFARALAMASPKGIPGKRLISFAGTIEVEDLQAMEQAIQENCEKVDLNEW